MELLGIQPRDVYVLTEFSRTDLRLLHKALDLVQIDYDGTIPEQKEAVEYFVGKFTNKVNEILQNLEAEYGNAPDTKTE